MGFLRNLHTDLVHGHRAKQEKKMELLEEHFGRLSDNDKILIRNAGKTARLESQDNRLQARNTAPKPVKVVTNNQKQYNTTVTYAPKKGINDNTAIIGNKSGGKSKTAPKKSTSKSKKH